MRRSALFLFVALSFCNSFRAVASPLYRPVGPRGRGVYAVAPGIGVRYSDDGGVTWSDRNDGLPLKVVYPFDGRELRDVNSLSLDHRDPRRVAVVTDSALFISDDFGREWRRAPTDEPVKPVDVFTAVAIVPGRPDVLYLGTSFNGLFRTDDGGDVWLSLEESLSFLYLGAGFYEEIRAVAASALNPRLVVLAAGFGGGMFLSDDEGESWRPIDAPGKGSIEELYFRSAADVDEELVVVRGGEAYAAPSPAGPWRIDETPEVAPMTVERPSGFDAAGRAERKRAAENRYGIYVNAAFASGDRLEAHLDLLETHGMNSMVVDMKDDAGYITYDTDLDLPRKMDAVRERFSLDALVKRAHDAGVYLIGRIVVFQDPRLYRFRDGAYAVWDGASEAPWGNLIPVRSADGELVRHEQREFWVDPYAEDVWRYNVAVAEELERRGVDEIQFDYVRFPSDGDTSAIVYRFRREGMTKSDALESLLRLAREAVDIPIGVDVFGFNGWYRMGNWIGQSLPILSRWVDVVSPMFYPSHYPRSFLEELAYFYRAEVIYKFGADRAAELVGGAAVIRPYVQAFLIGAERRYEEAEYDEYLRRQLDGVAESKASGFTLWNASNVYYMIVSPLTSYTSGEEGGR